MSRNGSGTQSSPGASFPAVTGTTIDSSKFNAIINDINSEITKSICNDGQTPVLANLPMGGFKHTGAGQASAAGQYMEYAQVTATYAPLASPALTGNPTAPTQTAGDNSTKIATTAYSATAITNLLAATNSWTGTNTFKGITETVYTITDGAAFEINPANGSIQIITLGASRTPKGTNFAAGQSITLQITAGAYTLTWTDTTFGASGVKWIGGSAPTLSSTVTSTVVLWKIGSQVYGKSVGDA